MHPKSGAIAAFENQDDAKAAGYTVPLSSAQFKQFQGMNRQQRRAEIRAERRKASAKGKK